MALDETRRKSTIGAPAHIISLLKGLGAVFIAKIILIALLPSPAYADVVPGGPVGCSAFDPPRTVSVWSNAQTPLTHDQELSGTVYKRKWSGQDWSYKWRASNHGLTDVNFWAAASSGAIDTAYAQCDF